MQTPDEDPRSAFVRHLPRKIVEIKATLGAVLADPRQLRMRDELRRRVDAVLTIARAHQLRSLSDGLQATVDALTESRAVPALGRPQLDRLTALVASLSARAELDTRDPDAPGARAMAIPSTSRSDHAPTRTLIPGAALSHGGPGLLDLARAVTGRTTDSLVPARGPVAHATQVLFVGSSIRASALLDALSHEADVLLAQTADEAISRARDAAPDIILAEDDPPYDGVALAAAVAADPLVRFIPVAVIACDGEPAATVRERCPEALDIFESDVSAEALRARIQRALRGSPSLPPTAHQLGELTLDELIRALQDELRRGLGGAALPSSRGARVALGAGNEVLAATWEAIARIRSVVERRSGGTVRFELPITPRGLQGAEVFSPGGSADGAAIDEPADDPLPGRRALVVDDDPAVVAQFSDLLRGAGMIVSGHTDGAEALSAARAERPDVVLADILMPGVDGFALCRAIRRDVALRHTPVILLSWREDLLVRMRELGAQASGYLRKEAAGSAVLARVRSTLRGRARTLKRIAELPMGGEVRGRLERVGSVELIESTAKMLADATISLADSGSMTELEVRQGALVSAVRTVQDGSLSRGEAALARALALNTARFVVRRTSHPVRENIVGKLSEVLERSARSVTALEEAVSGAALLEVVRVEFDSEAALEYARSLPTPLRVAVERMVQGDAPREMVLRDGLAPQDLEPLLIELSRRGAIQRVVGRNREDLAAARPARPAVEPSATWESFDLAPVEATPARAEVSDVLAKITRPIARSVVADTLADAVWRELRDSVEEPLRPARPTSRGGAQGPASDTAAPAPEVRWEVDDVEPRATRSLVPLAPREPNHEPLPDPALEPEVEELSSSSLMVVRPSMEPEMLPASRDPGARETLRPMGDEVPSPVDAPVVRAETRPAPSPASPPEQVLAAEGPADAETAKPADHLTALLELDEQGANIAIDLVVHRGGRTGEVHAEKPADEPPAVAEPAPEPAPEPLELPDIKTSTTISASVPPVADAKSATTSATRSTPGSTTSQSTGTTADEPSWTRPLLLMLGVAAALALSYGAVRWYLAQEAAAPSLEVLSVDLRDAGTPSPEATPEATAPTAAPAGNEESIQPQGLVPAGPAPLVTVNGPYRDAALFLDGGALAPTHGVLLIPAPRPGGSPVEVTISNRPVGTAPLQRVLREGFYQVFFRAGVVTSNQFVVVRRGLAAVLPPPTER